MIIVRMIVMIVTMIVAMILNCSMRWGHVNEHIDLSGEKQAGAELCQAQDE